MQQLIDILVVCTMAVLTYEIESQKITETCCHAKSASLFTPVSAENCKSCLQNSSNVFLFKRNGGLECKSCSEFPHPENDTVITIHFVVHLPYCSSHFQQARYSSLDVTCTNALLPMELYNASLRDNCLCYEEFVSNWKHESMESTTHQDQINSSPEISSSAAEGIVAQSTASTRSSTQGIVFFQEDGNITSSTFSGDENSSTVSTVFNVDQYLATFEEIAKPTTRNNFESTLGYVFGGWNNSQVVEEPGNGWSGNSWCWTWALTIPIGIGMAVLGFAVIVGIAILQRQRREVNGLE